MFRYAHNKCTVGPQIWIILTLKYLLMTALLEYFANRCMFYYDSIRVVEHSSVYK